MNRFWAVLFVFVFTLVSISGASMLAQGPVKDSKDNKTATAADKTATVPKELKEYAERSQKSAEVLTEVMNVPEKGIPQELMERAKGIAVIPHVIKGAFGIGGRYGKGLVSQRMPNGNWSTPAFVEIGGGSFGFQIGAEATDLVLVFANEEGLKSLLKGKVTLGADASIAAGPVGRSAEASTDVRFNSAVYSYSRSKGLFAGLALDGAAVTMDDSANKKVYGKTVSGEDILLEKQVKSNSIVRPFADALAKYSPATKRTTE